MHLQAYVVTALQMFSLDAVNATEFLEVYKGVVPPGEFSGMLDELTSGTCLLLAAECQQCNASCCGTMPQSDRSSASVLSLTKHSPEMMCLISACKGCLW